MSVILKKKGDLSYYEAEGIGASHCFTTRLGGVSEGYLSSMNIGTSRGDQPENVLKNYDILGKNLGFDPHMAVLSRQVHSDIVRVVGKDQAGAGLYAPHLSDCDGLITNEKGLALVIFTADCTPILFWDPETGAVGAAHAGWRGTAKAIGARTVEAMAENFGCKPRNIRAAIGPNIGKCHFETNADVPEAMVAAFGEEVKEFIFPQGEKFHVDLKAINAMVLRRAGVQHIEISTACTACRSDLFWSHRVLGQKRGSEGAVIVCGEGCK